MRMTVASEKVVTMGDTREIEPEMTDEHLFFPEWADRPSSTETLREADHNSYLAGGYAEEFGHRVREPVLGTAAPPSEEDEEWRVQIGCLHPGYPECPRPLDRDSLGKSRAAAAVLPDAQPGDVPYKISAGYRVIVVDRNSADRLRYTAFAAGLARMWRALSIRRHKLPLT